MSPVLLVTVPGSVCWPSRSSRAGAVTSATFTGPFPGGQPVGGFDGGCGAGGVLEALVTTEDGADRANVLPSELTASTRKRTVLPTSTEVSLYLCDFAPLMVAQLPPFLSQRTHEKLKSVGLFFHVPLWPKTPCPSWAEPVIVGGSPGCGFAVAAATPEPAKTPSAPTITALTVAPESAPASIQRFLFDLISDLHLVRGTWPEVADCPVRKRQRGCFYGSITV